MAKEKNAAATQKQDRSYIVSLLVIAGVVVLGVALMLMSQLRGGDQEMAPGSAHFEDYTAYPEMSEEGVKGAIVEAYYTNDGSLCLKLRFSNGTNAVQRLQYLYVEVGDEDGALIASGSSENLNDYAIPALGYNDNDGVVYTFYIPEEFVKIDDDDLDVLNYEIVVTSESDVEDTSTTDTATTTTATGDASTTSSSATLTTAAE